jgi:transposase
MENYILGIHVAEQVFQVHGADRRGPAVHRANVSRGSLFEAVRTLAPGVVVMEECGTAHHLHDDSSLWASRSA